MLPMGRISPGKFMLFFQIKKNEMVKNFNHRIYEVFSIRYVNNTYSKKNHHEIDCRFVPLLLQLKLY